MILEDFAMNTAVVYYSGKGSNRYLAGKASEALGCEALELVPRAPGLVLPATLTRISLGNKPFAADFSSYDRVVLCGPLYMGRIAAPCSDFIGKYGKDIKTLDFITCCGSTDDKKDDTFGYGRVFAQLKDRLGDRAGLFEAFPIELLLSEEQRGDDQAMMNTRLNEGNYKDEVSSRLENFISKLKTE
jgi:flavodoxin